MKTTMVIPSYWSRERALGMRETDAIYDHPTPLDSEGTLRRTLESLNVLRDKDFEVVVIAVANSEDSEDEVERKVATIIASVDTDVKIHLFSHSHLQGVKKVIEEAGEESFSTLLKLQGYSNIRNLCLFIPHVLDSEIAILIDDDEVFEDPEYLSKAQEFIARSNDGNFVGAVAGYYLQSDGDWRLSKPKMPWMEHWDQTDRMNEAFEEIIGREPRLKETPFVFGGNMVVHREVFTRIPFDPNITRGEDIDFLINMRMFGYKFYLDNTLAIKHLPPPKPHQVWKQLQQDVYRFVYERAKIREQKLVEGMICIQAEDLDPYPGAFLRDDLEEKISQASEVLAEQYREEGKEADAKEALRNIEIVGAEAAPKFNVFNHLRQLQQSWERMMGFAGQVAPREKIRQTLLAK